MSSCPDSCGSVAPPVLLLATLKILDFLPFLSIGAYVRAQAPK